MDKKSNHANISLPSIAWPVYFLSKTLCLQLDYLDLDPEQKETTLDTSYIQIDHT